MEFKYFIKAIFTKQYYRYWYFKIKREKLADYFFFHFPTFILLSLIFSIGLCWLFPETINLKIPTIPTQIYILESIAKNITLFFGILFSFVILSFNIFYRYFGRSAFLMFFKNKGIKINFTVLISDISLLIYSTSYLKDLKISNNYSNFLFLFCLVLTVYSFVSFFPAIIVLLKNSQSRKNIKDLFARLNENWLFDEFESRINGTKHSFFHKDPITILNEIGAASIKEFDIKTTSVISSSCSQFFVENIKSFSENNSGVDNGTLYKEFNQLLYNLFLLGLKEKNQAASIQIIMSRFRIEESVLKNLTVKGLEDFRDYNGQYKHWSLNLLMKDFFEKSLQFNEDEIGKRLINDYRNFVRQSIPILFPPNFKYTEIRRFQLASEAGMVFEPLQTVNDLIQNVLIYKKAYLLRDFFSLYSDVEEAVSKLNILSSHSKLNG